MGSVAYRRPDREKISNRTPRMGKTWRRSRTYYKSNGYRVGDAMHENYRGYTGEEIHSVYPKWVTDSDCWGMHYQGGEFHRKGWKEPVSISKLDRRLSAKGRRTYEKRQFRKMLLELDDS